MLVSGVSEGGDATLSPGGVGTDGGGAKSSVGFTEGEVVSAAGWSVGKGAWGERGGASKAISSGELESPIGWEPISTVES